MRARTLTGAAGESSTKRMLSGLRSRWHTPCERMCRSAPSLELVEGVALHLYLGLVLAQDGGEVRVLRLVALVLLRMKVNLRCRRSQQHPGNCIITVYRQNIQNVQ